MRPIDGEFRGEIGGHAPFDFEVEALARGSTGRARRLLVDDAAAEIGIDRAIGQGVARQHEIDECGIGDPAPRPGCRSGDAVVSTGRECR
jgi:hypothetical protein